MNGRARTSGNDPQSAASAIDVELGNVFNIVKQLEPGEKSTSSAAGPISECLLFTRSNSSQGYNVDTRMLRNNMLFGVSLLELANAGDFAANVWNTIPVPIFVVVLMAIGGSFALIISCFAFWDAKLSWRNVRLLRDERAFLKHQTVVHRAESRFVISLHCRLDVNFRELGTELVSRFGMDLIMGFASVLVGTGTLLAIGGENRRIFHASNLLSGYIGNTPAAFWGAANAVWYIFVWRRAKRHNLAAEREFGKSDSIGIMLHRRTTIVRYHAIMNSIAGFFAGVASMITSKYWYGYVALAPCIVAALASNHIFRRRILYTRPGVQTMALVDKEILMRQLKGILSIRELPEFASTSSLSPLCQSKGSLPTLITYIVELGLFETFCGQILRDPMTAGIFFGSSSKEIIVNSEILQNFEGTIAQRMFDTATKLISIPSQLGSPDREAFLIDTLGSFLSMDN